MKRGVFLVLALVMCFVLTACGNANLTVSQVEEAFADVNGTLDMESSGNQVTGFTFTVECRGAGELAERNYCLEAMNEALTKDTNDVKIKHLYAVRAIAAVMSAENLITGEEADFEVENYVNRTLDILCDGDVVQLKNWMIWTEIDAENNTVTISAQKQ